MTKNKSVKRNYIYNLSYQILVVLTPLITTPYLSRVLGKELIGTYSFTASIVALFAMVAAASMCAFAEEAKESKELEKEEER